MELTRRQFPSNTVTAVIVAEIGYPVATELDNGEIRVVDYGYSTQDLGTCSPHGVFCTRVKKATVVSPSKP